MAFFKVAAARAKGLTAGRVVDSGVIAKGRRKFTRGQQSPIGRCGGDMFGVTEAATPKDTVEFECVKFGAMFNS
jgi:hypothetical protein